MEAKARKAEDMLNRFRSKEDLYRYLHLHRMLLDYFPQKYLVKVFLPSIGGTKLSFIRDIVADKKLHLKQNEINHMEVPVYPELSVKNMYDDAMGDVELAKYLPSREQLSGKLPERDFFFGILCTLKHQYMSDVIAEAHKKRYKIEDGDDNKTGILITGKWLKEPQQTSILFK